MFERTKMWRTNTDVVSNAIKAWHGLVFQHSFLSYFLLSSLCVCVNVDSCLCEREVRRPMKFSFLYFSTGHNRRWRRLRKTNCQNMQIPQGLYRGPYSLPPLFGTHTHTHTCTHARTCTFVSAFGSWVGVCVCVCVCAACRASTCLTALTAKALEQSTQAMSLRGLRAIFTQRLLHTALALAIGCSHASALLDLCVCVCVCVCE